MSRDAGDRILVSHPIAEARWLKVELTLDPATHEVAVVERLSLDGARPLDANEASMRSLGEPAFDPTRPKAQRISGRTAQTRIIEPALLDATPVSFHGPRANLPPDFAASLDEKRIVTLLCAVVTRSGWSWRPMFFRG